MTKKASFYAGTLLLGVCLLAAGLLSWFWGGEELKTITGAGLGIGAGLSAMSIVNLLMKRMERKNPEQRKQSEIEFHDERNTFIRHKAKAKAADFIQWCVIGIAYVTIIIGAPLWATLVVVGVYVLYGILVLFYTGKYQKEI